MLEEVADALEPVRADLADVVDVGVAGEDLVHRHREDLLVAAGATFTLLAWGFAYAFFVCQAVYPDSFYGIVEPERPRRWLELLSLSFSNLSATGLSDIVPIGSPARVLVMLEQFAGVGYIATVVSRLIGLTIIRHRR